MNTETLTSATSHDYSNIVTPPDFVMSASMITLIDPEWSDVENLAFYLKTSPNVYTVFVYRSEMNESEWLAKAIKNSQAIIINTVETPMSPTKDKIALAESAFHYGPKNFLMNMNNHLNTPIDYFVKLDQPK